MLSQHSICKHGCSHSTIIDACIAAQLTIHIGTGAITAPSSTCWMECQTCDVVTKCGCTLSAHPNNILSQHGTRRYYHSIACCFWLHVKMVVSYWRIHVVKPGRGNPITSNKILNHSRNINNKNRRHDKRWYNHVADVEALGHTITASPLVSDSM